jgi:hypothetical protein
MKKILIRPYGRNANQMLQYMFARMLCARVSNSEVAQFSLPMYRQELRCQENTPEAGPTLVLPLGHRQNIDGIVKFMDQDPCNVIIQSLSLRVEYYEGYLKLMRELFPKGGGTQYGDDHLVIAIRLDFKHPGYYPLPILWYKELVSHTGLKPVFVGETDSPFFHEYLCQLRQAFPTAIFTRQAPPEQDFDTFRINKNVVCAIGTFSWLATFLSEVAENVYVPLAGILNPLQRPDINVISRDVRYRYTQFPVARWQKPKQNTLGPLLKLLENYTFVV